MLTINLVGVKCICDQIIHTTSVLMVVKLRIMFFREIGMKNKFCMIFKFCRSIVKITQLGEFTHITTDNYYKSDSSEY